MRLWWVDHSLTMPTDPNPKRSLVRPNRSGFYLDWRAAGLEASPMDRVALEVTRRQDQKSKLIWRTTRRLDQMAEQVWAQVMQKEPLWRQSSGMTGLTGGWGWNPSGRRTGGRWWTLNPPGGQAGDDEDPGQDQSLVAGVHDERSWAGELSMGPHWHVILPAKVLGKRCANF